MSILVQNVAIGKTAKKTASYSVFGWKENAESGSNRGKKDHE
jgi:hypothetical protein